MMTFITKVVATLRLTVSFVQFAFQRQLDRRSFHTAREQLRAYTSRALLRRVVDGCLVLDVFLCHHSTRGEVRVARSLCDISTVVTRRDSRNIVILQKTHRDPSSTFQSMVF